ncbi:MAG: penicillin-binding protein 2 [Limnochordia bacterium]|jgi:penicillin-binding protein 2
MAAKQLERRLRWLTAVVVAVFLILAGRLWYLQIYQGETYVRLADGNRLRMVRLMAPRGLIYDRHGRVLVTNRPAFTVSVVPEGLKMAHEVLPRLSEILAMEEDEIRRFIQRGGPSAYEPVRIRRDVDPQTVVTIEESRLALPGVIVEETPMRDYLYGDLGSHIFGYLSMISSEELRRLEGYSGTDLIGRTGLERYYEAYLRGVDGSQQVEVNALNRPVRVLEAQEPVPGSNLILTIDWDLQLAAETALEEQLALVRETTEAKGAFTGAVIVLDPRTGDVLALVSQPRYDPNRFIEPGYDPNRFLVSVPTSYYEEIQAAPSALNNYATAGLYHPGSAFKPITMLAALQEGIVNKQTRHVCTGYYKYGRRCWTVTNNPPLAPHGSVDYVKAMADSCNVYFWSIAEEMGIGPIANTARAFGLERPTGIDLHPAEPGGLVPDPLWKHRQYRLQPEEQGWYPGDTLNVAIGQVVQVTPLQMAVFYGALATKGELYQPRLVQRITSPRGEIEKEFPPHLVDRIDLPERIWQMVHQGMEAVITEGTARRAFQGFPIPVAGKTGSAQASGGQPHAWFGAWAPAKDPEVVVMVMAANAGGGASVAAPVARQVLEAYFAGQLEEE